MKLSVLKDPGLNEDRRAVRIESGRKPVHRVVEDVCANVPRRFVVCRECVPIHNAVKAFVLVLQPDPVLQRANQMAQMKAARWPHAAQDSWFTHGDIKKRSTRVSAERVED